MKEGGGGVALMYLYVWEHIVSLYYRTAEWMFTKLGRDEILMAHALRCIGKIHPGADPGAKIGHGGPLLQWTSSSEQKATATNQMDSNDLEAYGKKRCYFWFHFWCDFDVFLDLVILVYFNATLIDLYAVKCFFCIILCNFHVYKWEGECLNKRFIICLKNINEFFYVFI